MSFLPNENIYGHRKRLDWLLSNINKNETVLEFGCGTGHMICHPLASLGYNIFGVDLDEKSINFGKELLSKNGLDPQILVAQDIRSFPNIPDVIIASEVFEHIRDSDLKNVLGYIKGLLPKEGRLLVTVPNGYGWFELESFLWFKAKLGKLIEFLRIDRIIRKFKHFFLKDYQEDMTPSTLSDSPHVQRFTYRSIKTFLENEGFFVNGIKGSVLFAGPFSNLLFSGVSPILNFNRRLGNYFPKLSSGFFISCKV